MFKSACGVVGLAFLTCTLVSCGTNGDGDGTSPTGGAAKPAAETAAYLDTNPAPEAEETDTLRFLLLPFYRTVPFKVDSIALDGSVRIRVKISEQMTQEFTERGISPRLGAAMVSHLTEGYFLGLSGLPEAEGVTVFDDIRRGIVAIDGVNSFRAQVLRLEEEGQAVVRVGPAAAKHLKKGDTLLLVRPTGATTSQIQAVPDLVPVTDDSTESTGIDSKTATSLVRSVNNLKQIGLAMHYFHDTYGHFPPAVIYGPDGNPWHSWRVLLLPFLDEAALYDQYRFNEPWHGPNNKGLLDKIPSCYQDPIHGQTEDAYTHYAVAVGKGAGFSTDGHRLAEDVSESSWRGIDRPVGARRLADFMDGSSNTLLVGSVSPGRKIPWMKPEDVVFDEQFPGLGKERGFAAPYKTDKGAGGAFVFADGFATTVREDIDIALLRSLVQIADGGLVDIDDIPKLQPVSRDHDEPVLVLTVPRDTPDAVAKLTIEELHSQAGLAGSDSMGALEGVPPNRDRPKPTPVTGTVTYNGMPVDGATVTFAPVSNNGEVSVGVTDAAGAYTLKDAGGADGAVPGKYKVTIIEFEGGGAAGSVEEEAELVIEDEGGAEPAAIYAFLPMQYSSIETTPFECEVKAGADNNFTLELTD